MSYDRDSFLAGLAVGRTLWRPHTVAPGPTPVLYPCFSMNTKVPVGFIKSDVDYDGILFSNADESLWPSPIYWMLWEANNSNQNIYFFSPGGQTNSQIYLLAYGCVGSTTTWFSTTVGYLTRYNASTLGQYRIIGPYRSEIYTAALFDEYDYFTGTQSEINAFFETASLTQIGNQLYVVGVSNAV